ncbi:hypothetical protein E1B28_002425 [Marasmius oreades]|uniref:T-cell immunomodulatory protein TIP C2 domain-containing protein n=1 Tax=Marasmius oreades TaxID=181124 RepID=A0A9P7RMM1_9AGAR|nr:uncharacterized protein E1B28_002425 [Marasmius oreades]KAG7086474.1 hypothetical protein E1B28_002425 [Marasmius oreades]
MQPRLCRAAILYSILSLVSPAHGIWPFPPKRFTGNSLVDAGSLGLSGERVIAFGDFNGDQYLDVLMLEDDRRTLSVFLWNHEKFEFDKSGSFKHPNEVYNVVPADFTHSGQLDLLVMSPSQSNSPLDLTLYPALPSGGFGNLLSLPSSSLSQPIPIDLNGDMKIDLLGMTPDSQSSDKEFQVWENIWNSSETRSPLFKITDAPFHGKQCKISHPHSNAVIDLNGDCLADVFLVCDDGRGGKFFQIWVNNKEDGFSLAQEHPLPTGTLQVSLADMDRDGTIDLVFPTCRNVNPSTGIGTDCYINIAYNQQLPLCSAEALLRKGTSRCRTPEDLCIPDPDFKFDLTEGGDTFVRIPLSSILTSSPPPGLLVEDTTTSPSIPLALNLGDADLDGFPDILLIAVNQQGQVPKLIYSVPCGDKVLGCSSGGSGRRGWKTAIKGVQSLETIKDARSAVFMDMDEDGTRDIMVQRTGKSMQGNIMFVQNNFYYDAFFLKAIVLNGACGNGMCYSEDGQSYHPFGVSYSGASYKYTVLDTSGRRSAAQIGQLPQTGYQSLQSPYAFFGLGRTNNYIENLFVGSTIHSDQHYINIEGVIPNSKLVIRPSADKGTAWKRELFLRPGDWIPWVTVTMIIGTIVLAVIVFVLHLNEKREDELERRRASHHINFDAL